MKLLNIRYLALILTFLTIVSCNVFKKAQTDAVVDKADTTETVPAQEPVAEKKPEVDNSEIHWMTWDDVQVAMKKEPKKVWVDVYTDWCGWCKVMDKKTFSHPEVIKYMNEHFYAVKFDAESKEDIRFMGNIYSFSPEHRANLLAAKLMGGKMSYPTNIFMEEHFKSPSAIPGYQPVPQIEVIMKFLAEEKYKEQSFEEYSKNFEGSWQQMEEG